MRKDFLAASLLPLAAFLISGCATTRPRHAETPDAGSQMAAMQAQLQAKDQEIQDLRSQLESLQPPVSTNFAGRSSDKYHILRVPGVTPVELQKTLLRAGFDPGPADGRLGKKTRQAVKAFQRKNHLTSDGVVGEKTWAALRSY